MEFHNLILLKKFFVDSCILYGEPATWQLMEMVFSGRGLNPSDFYLCS